MLSPDVIETSQINPVAPTPELDEGFLPESQPSDWPIIDFVVFKPGKGIDNKIQKQHPGYHPSPDVVGKRINTQERLIHRPVRKRPLPKNGGRK